MSAEQKSRLALAGTALFAIGGVAGFAAPTILKARTASPDAAVLQPVAAGDARAAEPVAQMTVPNYRAIVARNQAAVVGITTASIINANGPELPEGISPFGGGDEDPFFPFFRNMPRHPRGGLARAQGSGFIIASDGVILTNAHVVDGAKEVTVKLSDHREFKAKVLGSDKTSDIAVLKIDARDLPTVRVGNSDQIAVGDYVLAIGQPFGLEETATAGIVSAKGRSLPGDGYVPFIQTDAAVNPGNSGGPLFDSSGSVIGINAQIYSNSGGYQGVAFAIPINVAVQIKDQIMKTGRVEHAQLGVEVQTLDQSLANSFHLNAPNGALVSRVDPDSAAARAGLRAGDVILKYNDINIGDAGQLAASVGMSAPGSKAQLEIWRDGRRMTREVTIGTAGTGVLARADAGGASEHGKLGLSVRPLDRDERQQAGVEGGLVVERAQGPAAEAGIQPGDVVLSVDGKAVASVEQLRKLVQTHDRGVALLIQRGDSRIFVPVRLS